MYIIAQLVLFACQGIASPNARASVFTEAPFFYTTERKTGLEPAAFSLGN